VGDCQGENKKKGPGFGKRSSNQHKKEKSRKKKRGQFERTHFFFKGKVGDVNRKKKGSKEEKAHLAEKKKTFGPVQRKKKSLTARQRRIRQKKKKKKKNVPRDKKKTDSPIGPKGGSILKREVRKNGGGKRYTSPGKKGLSRRAPAKP